MSFISWHPSEVTLAPGNFVLIYAGVSSTYVSVFLQSKGRRASQYLALIARRTRVAFSAGRMRAVAANSGPMIFPRRVQGAILTCGVLRMRLTLPSLLLVMK